MTNDSHKPACGVTRRFFRILLLWVLLPICLLTVAGVGSLYLLCTYKPEIVTSSVQYHLRAATGLPWRIRGAIRPALWPYPGVSAADVRIAAATTGQEAAADPARPLMHAKNVLIYLDPVSLLKWRPVFQRIELVEPAINLAHDAAGRPLWFAPDTPDAGERTPARTPEGPPDRAPGNAPAVDIDETPAPGDTPENALGDSSAAAPAESSGTTSAERLERAAATICALPPSLLQPVSIRNGSFVSWTQEGEKLLSFTGVDARFLPDEEDNFTASAAFELPGADLVVHFSIAARVGCEGIPARGRVNGDIAMTPPGSRPLTARFASSAVWLDTGKDVRLPDFYIEAEGDTLSAGLTADLSLARCVGKVSIGRLSLTRWFGFGRVLPPGLRETLHHLTGSFDLLLDATRAEAHNLEATAGALSVKGYVGTPDFSAPVVVVDVALDRAELDPVFPFLAAVGRYVPEPQPPVFDHPPLAPYPDDPDAPVPGASGENAPGKDASDEDGISVSYDIAIRVARPRVHDVDGGPLLVTVLPATVKGVEKTRVGIDANDLLEGSVKGWLDIDENSIMMHYDAKGMELALLPENRDNTVRIAGKVTGACDMELPFLANGDIADDWKLDVNAHIDGCAVTGFYHKAPWQLYADRAAVSGKGSIFAVLEKGVRIEGNWNIGVQGVNTTWHPKGNDKLGGLFTGGLFWPPIKGGPPPSGQGRRSMERKGVEQIKGALNLDGSLIVPLGSLRVPLTGKLATALDWRLYDDVIRLEGAKFNGMGSYSQGGVAVDFSGAEVVVTADSSFKINPRELLGHWKMLPPPSVTAPRVLTGRMDIEGKNRALAFRNIKVEADGAPVTGQISWQETPPGGEASDAGHWIFRLSAAHFDLDTLLPPDPPGKPVTMRSQEPWKLKALKDLSIDAQITLARARRNKLSFTDTKVTAALQRDRFSVHCESRNFYDGTAVLLFQGTVVPDRSQVTLRKGLMQLERVNFGKLLRDYTGDQQYGGSADLLADYTGTMSCDADIPAKLSGVWNLSITDGLYPAFLSGDNSTLRNTFSRASASGPLEKGIIRTRNFILNGPMVDMAGDGWYDLTHNTYDIEVSATFAKVPTVPMRFYGNATEHRMTVSGVEMVVETMQAAGSTVFELVKGVLSLPAYAVQGIGSLFEGKKTPPPPAVKQPAVTLPVAPQRSGGVQVRP